MDVLTTSLVTNLRNFYETKFILLTIYISPFKNLLCEIFHDSVPKNLKHFDWMDFRVQEVLSFSTNRLRILLTNRQFR